MASDGEDRPIKAKASDSKANSYRKVDPATVAKDTVAGKSGSTASAEQDQPTKITKPARAAKAKSAGATGAKSGAASAAKGASKKDATDKPATDADAAEAKGKTLNLAAPAAAKKIRAAASRVRASNRVDTRTNTRKKPAAPKPRVDQMSPLASSTSSVVANAPAAQPQSAPKPAERQTPEGGNDSQTTTAFFEAAFGPDSLLPERMVENIERLEALTQRLAQAMTQRRPRNPGVEGPGPDLFATATTAWLKSLAEQPARILEQQVSYWGETLRHFAEAQQAFARGTLTAPPDDGPKDRRFSNPLWETHPYFNFIKRQYQINAHALHKAAAELDIEDMTERRRIDWFTRQMIDMMAPTNFLATNPDALEKAIATEGESLVKGLENLVRDVEQNNGELIVTLADRDAFKIGQNIATTEGNVVARTRLYELIQYQPTTAQVHAIPVVIFPPWINKFYIMDLKPQNSLIKWIVDQGFTLFVVAWKNPDVSYAETGIDDYVSAYIEVMDRIQDLTGQPKLNAVGYCIAGTTLALTLSLLKQRGDDRVNSATFFTTLTDFSEQGEFTAYLQDDFVGGIQSEVENSGILSSQLMQRTFSFLRANDLVWGPAIRSYMLGEMPPAFDLLFWNGDSTNLPGRMAIEYLRGLCQDNSFAKGEFVVHGQKVNLSDIDLPLCAIACESDHIAPWKDSWRGIAQMGSKNKQFIVSESGHIAGIVNPPNKKKYGHYTSDAGFEGTSDDWFKKAQFTEGSWWGRWAEWLSALSGPKVEAVEVPETGFGPAPGTYVHERY